MNPKMITHAPIAVPPLNRYPAELAPTPLVPVQLAAGAPSIWCKLEFLNPSGSTKDRIARYILRNAVTSGAVAPGGLVIEASSGSTSVAMALVCAQLGLRFLAVMPEGVSSERVLMIRAYGGQIHFCSKDAGVVGCIQESERLAKQAGGFLPRQFANPENAEAHERGTAHEILAQIPGGRVDAVVSGVGTGGTLVGLTRGCTTGSSTPVAYLARPVDLGVGRDHECCSFSCRIPGVVDCASELFKEADFPGLRVVEVSDVDAISATRKLISLGFPVGPSSGLNYCAAVRAAEEMESQQVFTVFPDRMERYFTTDLFRPFQER